MGDPLLRLMWALPLVLVLGTAAILVLKRRLAPTSVHAPAPCRTQLRLIEELALPDESRLFLVDISGSMQLVVSSNRHVSLHTLDRSMRFDDAIVSKPSSNALWMLKLLKGAAK